jgi:predicted phage baseplate assembly protein
MNGNNTMSGTCGCCQGVTVLTPAVTVNAPELVALNYRVGTHGSFKATMVAALAGQPALRSLTTREDDDPAIGIADAWATVLDVLTFYQERIAGEGFLRTATERRSVLELARAIGYELRPGVAAGTFLAFTLETAEGSPKVTKIQVGTKAQSVPGPGESPQTFEAVEEIEARVAWNAIPVKSTELVLPTFGDDTLWLAGTDTNLKPGDALLLVGREREQNPGSENWDFRRVKAIDADFDNQRTKVTVDLGLGSTEPHVEPAKQDPKVYALRLRTSLFGASAPDWRAMSRSFKRDYLGVRIDPDPPADVLAHYRQWPDYTIASISDPPGAAAPGTGLYGEYFNAMDFTERKLSRIDGQINFDWGAGSPARGISADTFSIRWTGWVQPSSSGDYIFYTVSDDGVRLWVDRQLLIDRWNDHGQIKDQSPPIRLEAGRKYDIKLEFYEHGGAATIRLSWSGPGVPEQIIPQSRLYPRDIHTVHLDGIQPQITRGSWLVLSIPEYQEVYSVENVAEDARANFALSSKTTRLTLRGENLRELFNERIRDTAVFAQSEELPMTEQPITAPVSGEFVELAQPVEGLWPGQWLMVSGKDAVTGQSVSEVAMLLRAEPPDKATKLFFTTSLVHTYRRQGDEPGQPAGVTLNANVARATHGETRTEVLGGGDGAQAFQKLSLKEKPLTYVSAPTSSGAKSTLEVRVNDILWDEVPSFHGLPPDRRAYITRLADNGQVTVQFGDGVTGARLPTGQENVSARYRVGTGLPGNVKTGQITQLITRPLGTKSVVNPAAAVGGADPEKIAGARQNAPRTVLTLDRIVSLVDFEDFARAFSGIGKAQATWLWAGRQRLVHLTVAGAGGGAVPVNSDLFRNLQAGMNAARHPQQPVEVDSYQPRRFRVVARVLVDRRFVAADVLLAVEQAVADAFSFEQRFLGQAVTASELVAVMQKVNGVVAVDLDKLYFDGEPAAPYQRLPARVATWDEATRDVKPAELLTMHPEGIELSEMTP